MAIIYSYPVITSLANDDRLIISDMDSTTGNPTKSVTLSTLATFLGVSQTGGPFVPYVDGNGKRITRTEDTNKNTSLGFEALAGLTTGTGNVAMGFNAGKVLDVGFENVILGNGAGIAATGADYNVFIGTDAGKSYTTSQHSIAIGWKALELAAGNNTSFQIAIGRQALQNASTTSSFGNIAIGNEAGQDVTGTGWQNVFIGAKAGLDITEGQRNVALGFNALEADTDSNENVAIGASALSSQTAGPTASINSPRNIALGYQAGRGLTTGTNSIFIGFDAGNNTAMTGTNNVLIGDDASPTAAAANNEFTLGNSSTAVLRCQQTTITALSDQRDKTSIEDLPYGLDFVDLLQPKKFVWDNRVEFDGDGNEYFSANKGNKDIGFIAQELQTVDDEWLNLVYDSNPERLEASYGKLIPVLVKAIKELKARVEALEA